MTGNQRVCIHDPYLAAFLDQRGFPATLTFSGQRVTWNYEELPEIRASISDFYDGVTGTIIDFVDSLKRVKATMYGFRKSAGVV
jgi:hypothetical protein